MSFDTEPQTLHVAVRSCSCHLIISVQSSELRVPSAGSQSRISLVAPRLINEPLVVA